MRLIQKLSSVASITMRTTTGDHKLDSAVRIGAEILDKAKKEYEQGLRDIYQEHGRALFRYALAFTCSAEDAEDAVQEVFVRIAKEWKRFEAVANIKAYLISAVRNACYSILRTRKRSVALCEAVGAELCEVCSCEPGADSMASIALREAFAELPIEQREVLILKVTYEMTFQEISDTIGISINTAAGRYRYGVERLRRVWEDRENGR